MFHDRDMPLVEALLKKRFHHSYHVPAHKGRYGPPEFQTIWQDVLLLDQTELPDLDNLHQPQGVIAEAQLRAKEAFGVDATRFLVGGTTVGVLAAILGTTWAFRDKKGLWIVQRDSHQSVYHALMLTGSKALLLTPELDVYGLPLAQTASSFEAAVSWAERKGYTIYGLFLTSPNYYGRVSALRDITAFAHRKHIPVLVDAAHGGHLAFMPNPIADEAVSAGADLIVHSTHKTNGSLTMSSLLHYQGQRLPREHIDLALKMLMSSSPSYVLMASLDMMQALIRSGYMSARQKTLLPLVQELREALMKSTFYTVLTADDPFRLMLKVPDGLGAAVETDLRQKGLDIEFRHGDILLFIFSYADDRDTVAQLRHALEEIENRRMFDKSDARVTGASNLSPVHTHPTTHLMLQSRPFKRRPWRMQTFSPPQAMLKKSFQEALGKEVARMIIPYPPGIPLVLPGERFTAEVSDQLLKLISEGHDVHGIELGAQHGPEIWIHA